MAFLVDYSMGRRQSVITLFSCTLYVGQAGCCWIGSGSVCFTLVKLKKKNTTRFRLFGNTIHIGIRLGLKNTCLYTIIKL